MPRRSPLLLLIALLALLAASAPALAQTDDDSSPVKDLGNNIYMVDGNKGPIPNLLPAEEVQKIAKLQSAPFGPGSYTILSPVSPDDQTVLVGTALNSMFFLNLRDGTMVPLQFGAPLFPLSNLFWLDADTVGGLAIDVTSEALPAGLVCFDRRTGAGGFKEQCPGLLGRPGVTLPDGVPVLFSPNQRKVLLAVLPPDTEHEGAALVTPMPGVAAPGLNPTQVDRQSFFRARFARELAANPRALALADFARAFDPLPMGANLIVGPSTSLVVADMVTGESHNVLTLAPNSRVISISFSEDGSKFAAVTQSFGTIGRGAEYDGALLSEIIYRDVTGNLPPAENPLLQGSTMAVLDFSSGVTRTLKAADGDGAVYAGASWSTDNQTLAVKVNQPGRTAGRRYPQYWPQFQAGSSLRFYDAGLNEFRRLEKIELSDLQMSYRFVSPDELIISSHYLLDQHPWYYNVRSGELRRIADRPGTFTNVVPTNSSREIVFAYSSYTDPVDFYRMKWDGTAFARLTWFNEEVRQLSQTAQHPVSFTLRDGSTHSGVLILPADVPFPPKNVPIIVWQEGGPTGPINNSWFALAESPHALLPNFGFGVLAVPLYGRYGVGVDRFEALADGTNYGQIDIDAQNEIVAQMRARGWANKVGIVGCSYGGYFTTQSITRHPTTYDAAHTMCSLVDLFTEWSRGYNSLAPWFEGLPPPAALSEYAKDSPAYNAGRVRTPLLAFHGTNDFLPITVMENFMLQVINNKVPAKMLKFQDADHGFLRKTPSALSKAYELYGAQEQIIWFRTYLGK